MDIMTLTEVLAVTVSEPVVEAPESTWQLGMGEDLYNESFLQVTWDRET